MLFVNKVADDVFHVGNLVSDMENVLSDIGNLISLRSDEVSF